MRAKGTRQVPRDERGVVARVQRVQKMLTRTSGAVRALLGKMGNEQTIMTPLQRRATRIAFAQAAKHYARIVLAKK